MPGLNHTIVWCRDQRRSADFLTEALGLPPVRRDRVAIEPTVEPQA